MLFCGHLPGIGSRSDCPQKSIARSLLQAMDDKRYIQVCLPLKLEWNPWYSTTETLRIGQRVAVRLSGRLYIGVVVLISDEKPDLPKIYSVEDSQTGLEDISPEELELWRFIADYYMCTLGEVYKVAYPKEKIHCEQQALKLSDRATGRKEMYRQGLLSKIERLEQRLASKNADLAKSHRPGTIERLEGEKAALESQISTLRKELEALDAPATEEYYQNAIDFGSKPVLLLGADRFKYYLGEILRTLDTGRSALILEPETDFGFNLRDALSRVLGERLLFWGATTSVSQKREVLSAVRAGTPVAVIGIRPAIFLPWNNLGLVIVDEEQDASHKQQEQMPLYNGRDVAAVLARIHDARLLLGSACPSLESLHNCMLGKYDMLELPDPHPASIEIIDIPAERRKRGMLGNYSRRALDAIAALPEDALITVVRCYQSEEDAAAELRDALPGRDPQLLTAPAARRAPGRSALTLILNADALFDRTDFRADEKVLQLLSAIRAHTDRLIIQCGASSHPVFRALASEGSASGGLKGAIPAAMQELLSERKAFGLPPYTRIVDLKDKGSLVRREVLPRDRSLAARKAELKLKYGAIYTFDVDPL